MEEDPCVGGEILWLDRYVSSGGVKKKKKLVPCVEIVGPILYAFFCVCDKCLGGVIISAHVGGVEVFSSGRSRRLFIIMIPNPMVLLLLLLDIKLT